MNKRGSPFSARPDRSARARWPSSTRIPSASKWSALAAGGNARVFAAQVARYRPRAVAMASGAALDDVASAARRRRCPRCHGAGSEGLIAVATHPDVDVVLCASSGTAALEAVLAAIDAGKTIGLANKEVLVMAGGSGDGRGARAAASRFCRSTASTTPFTSACTAARRRAAAADSHRFGRAVPWAQPRPRSTQ